VRRALREIAQHKIAVVIGAVCFAAIAVISILGSSAGGTTSRSDPATSAAPAFSLARLGTSGRISLSDYQGKPLIVNFWASWCGPCQKETPLLAKFYRSQGGRVLIVGIDENDTAASALRFARAKGVAYPLAFDPLTIAAGSYGVSGIPQTFFLNARHQIVDRVFGAVTAADLAKGVALMDRG
jgi:cytochrome c biogenesis protein CcmG, thiol:disulfide interchange protein DsbE